jgi:predicted acylesterase/phospholipase RssA
MTPDGRVMRAMVLSGGSVYAAYEVGVLKALLRGESPATGFRRLEPDIYVGTSSGAVNAAIMASRPDQDILEALDFPESAWVDQSAADPATCREGAIRIRGDISQYADLRCLASRPALPLDRAAEDAAFFARFFVTRAFDLLSPPPPPRLIGRRILEFVDTTAFVSNEDFVRIIRRVVNLSGIRDARKILRVVTTNWRTGEIRVFANEDMNERTGHAVIEASAAFPGVRPVVIDGEPYVDGGHVLNTPLRPAVAAGGDALHVVFMDPDIKDIPTRRFDNTFDVIGKLYQITQANFFKWDISLARTVNTALDSIDRAGFGLSQVRVVLDVLGAFRWPKGLADEPLRQVEVHLYHPREDLGGALRLLNFDRDHITGLIAKGYADAVAHDCIASGCVLPEGGAGKRPLALGPIAARATDSTGGMIHA